MNKACHLQHVLMKSIIKLEPWVSTVMIQQDFVKQDSVVENPDNLMLKYQTAESAPLAMALKQHIKFQNQYPCLNLTSKLILKSIAYKI